jgi:peroxin-10
MNLANHFTIIRSYQKDDYYRSKLRIQLRNMAHLFINPSTCLKYSKEINLLADFFYYLTTTLANRQTIGQEYCNLVLFDELKRNIPSKLKRGLLIIIKIFLPYFLYRLKIKHISFDLLKLLFYYLNSLNTIYFFLTKTTFYKFENYLTNIKYLEIQNETNSTKNSKKLLLLASSLLIPLVYNLYVDLKKLKIYLTSYNNNNVDLENDKTSWTIVDSNKNDHKCLLCLYKVKNPTLTPCGHLYCWFCIQEYTQRSYNNYEKYLNLYQAQCPTCREKYKINKLIYLYNF